MDWIQNITDAERAAGALNPESEARALRALRRHGVAVLRGVFTRDLLDGLSSEFASQFGGTDAERLKSLAALPPPNPLLKVGKARYDALPSMTGAFADPRLIASPLLLGVLRRMLGEFMRMAGFTVVISCPGAEEQPVHRDYPQLFSEGNLGTVLPAYAINVSIPLVDVELETGPTGLWLGSHLWPDSREAKFSPAAETMTRVPFVRGDCVLLDYRLYHAGLANRSNIVRPLIYMVYARGWFYDELNHQNRSSLDMPMATFEALPEPVREVMFRVHVQAMRSPPPVAGSSGQA